MKFVFGPAIVRSTCQHDRDTYRLHRLRLGDFWIGTGAVVNRLRGGGRGSFVEKLLNPVASLAVAPVQTPIEHFRVKHITGDGRCLFRAIAQGVSRNKEIRLTAIAEESEADNLRMAVQEALCKKKEMQDEFRDVIRSLESPLPKYCKQLRSPTFWGGEPELLVLSKLLKTPIHVYKKESEFGSYGSGFVKIVEFGRDLKKIRYSPVKLLYSGSNHYDLLLD